MTVVNMRLLLHHLSVLVLLMVNFKSFFNSSSLNANITSQLLEFISQLYLAFMNALLQQLLLEYLVLIRVSVLKQKLLLVHTLHHSLPPVVHVLHFLVLPSWH